MIRKVICLVGSTGTGKSATALRLAETWPVTVINADSRQVFRDFPVITAQPTAEEQTRCPHRLYGFLGSEARVAAGTWSELANDAMASAEIPVLVGGTGLYLRALFDGIVTIPDVEPAVWDRLHDALQAEGSAALHQRLRVCDPVYAAKIHPNDPQRIVRALGVFEATGKPFSWWHSQTPPPREDVQVLRIGLRLSLDALTPLLERRIDAMLDAGALEEAQQAFANNADGTIAGWSGIGCRELHQYLTGEISFDTARLLWIKNTRAYAKRQLTWFNADTRIQWFAPTETQDVIACVRSFLA